MVITLLHINKLNIINQSAGAADLKGGYKRCDLDFSVMDSL